MQSPLHSHSRHVSAFVLVEPRDHIDSLAHTLRSLASQSRPADRVILGLNHGCSEEMRAFVHALTDPDTQLDDLDFLSEAAREAAHHHGPIDGVVEAHESCRLAGMSELFLAENKRCVAREREREQERSEREEQERLAHERNTQGARDFTLLTPSERKLSAAQEGGRGEKPGEGARRRGRRARDVDLEEITREHEKTLRQQALVPERLRALDQQRSSGGRRRAQVDDDQKWLWYLSAESSPAPDALGRLVDALQRTPTLSLVGPKHLAAEDIDEPTSRIVDLGITVTRSHRMVTSVEPGEIDQGQGDWRSDVLAVSMPGMLVREATLERLGGFDAMLTSPWAEVDVSQRIWRSGERVQVVPGAAVHAPLESVDETISSDFRTSQVLSLLKSRALGWALLTLLVFPLITLGRIIRGIVRHDASSVFREIRAFFRVLGGAPRALVAGRGARATSRVSRRRLAPLYMPWTVAARERLDSWWTYLFSDDERSRYIKRSTWGIAGTHHGMNDADYGRHTVWTIIVALVSAAAGVAAARSLLAPGTISGGFLVPPSASPADARDAIFSSWVPTSLGAAGPADPFARLMGHVPFAGDTIITALYLVIVPLTALSAWYAAGTVSRSIVVRLLATLMWVSAPPFLHAYVEGRWPLLIVHALIPLAAQFLARAIGLPHKVSQASIAAAAAGGLVIAVISSIQPVLGLTLILGLVLVVPWVPGRRRRLWWCAVPTLAVLAPNIPGYIRHPESLLTPAGMPFAFERASGLEMLAFAPSTADPLAAALRIDSTWLTMLAPAVPLLLASCAALLAPLLMHTAGVAGRIAVISAAGAFALAFLGVNAVIGMDGAEPITAYPGGPLSLAAAAVITGFTCTGDALARKALRGRGPFPLIARLAGGLALAVSVAVAGAWVLLLPTALEISPSTSPEIPAVASDTGLSSIRGRTLVLEQDSSGVVTSQLVNNGGRTLDQVSSQYLAFRADETEQGRAYDEAQSALVSAIANNVGATSTQSASASLGDFGITYVVVPGDVDLQAQLVDTLNTSPRFEQVTVSEAGGLWRVIDPASRADLTAADGTRIPLASERTRVVDSIEPVDEERTVTLSERADPRWHATLGGRELAAAQSGAWSQSFTVPPGASGTLIVWYDTPFITALVVLGYAIIAVSVLVAIPWKRRKEYER